MIRIPGEISAKCKTLCLVLTVLMTAALLSGCGGKEAVLPMVFVHGLRRGTHPPDRIGVENFYDALMQRMTQEP